MTSQQIESLKSAISTLQELLPSPEPPAPPPMDRQPIRQALAEGKLVRYPADGGGWAEAQTVEDVPEWSSWQVDPYSEVKLAFRAGKTIQVRCGSEWCDEWCDAKCTYAPTWVFPPAHYRVKSARIPLTRAAWIAGGPWWVELADDNLVAPDLLTNDSLCTVHRGGWYKFADMLDMRRTRDGKNFEFCSKEAP